MMPPKKKKNPGKPAIEITDLMISQVRKMAAYGLTQAQTANVLGIGEATLQRRLADEFKNGLAGCDNKISNNLKRIAMESTAKHIGATVTASIFYLKTRCGWHETQRIVHGFDPSEVMEFVTKVIAVIKTKIKSCPACKTKLDLGKDIAKDLLQLSQKMDAARDGDTSEPAEPSKAR